jgi:hypothetical protein
VKNAAKLVIPLVVIAVGLAIAVHFFVTGWRSHSDGYAQAEGSLFTFIAGVLSLCITLVYIHYTRRSLEVAEQAIKLQREQWEQKISVKPICWLELQEQGIFHLGERAGSQPQPFLNCAQFFVTIWNRGEQSILLTQVTAYFGDMAMPTRSMSPLQAVIAPNSVKPVDVTGSVINGLIVGPMSTVEEVVTGLIRSPLGFGISIEYSDWKETNVETPVYRGMIAASGTDRFISISVSPSPMRKGEWDERREDY